MKRCRKRQSSCESQERPAIKREETSVNEWKTGDLRSQQQYQTRAQQSRRAFAVGWTKRREEPDGRPSERKPMQAGKWWRAEYANRWSAHGRSWRIACFGRIRDSRYTKIGLAVDPSVSNKLACGETAQPSPLVAPDLANRLLVRLGRSYSIR